MGEPVGWLPPDGSVRADVLRAYRDRSLSSVAQRAYDYLATVVLHETDVRRVVTRVHCIYVSTDRESFAEALDALVASGYLVEHERDQSNVRRFTLARIA